MSNPYLDGWPQMDGRIFFSSYVASPWSTNKGPLGSLRIMLHKRDLFVQNSGPNSITIQISGLKPSIFHLCY